MDKKTKLLIADCEEEIRIFDRPNIDNIKKLLVIVKDSDQLNKSAVEEKRKRKSKWSKNHRELYYKYIFFVGNLDSEMAGNWLCKNKRSKETLGVVQYHEKWKEWTFEGLEFSFFNYSCLLDISDFLQKINSVKNLHILAKAVSRRLNSPKP